MKKLLTEIFAIPASTVLGEINEALISAGGQSTDTGFVLNGVDVYLSADENLSGSTMLEVTLDARNAAVGGPGSDVLQALRKKLADAEIAAKSPGAAFAGLIWGILGVGGIIGGLIIASVVWVGAGWFAGLLAAAFFLFCGFGCFYNAAGAANTVTELKNKIAAEEAATIERKSSSSGLVQNELDSIAETLQSIFKRLRFKHEAHATK